VVVVGICLTVNGTAWPAAVKNDVAGDDTVNVAERGGIVVGSVAVATPLAFVVALTVVPPDRLNVTAWPDSGAEPSFGSMTFAETVAPVPATALVSPV
jgi:hypothetical protein